ncbi:integrase core domain-containing protein [Paenibacillus maysiensis]|uniref:integrase core domain-containing protein n=1 Tax=Paenibacillus maysiensis TaxID=1155954 RepID=UPI000675D4CC|nr:integrase core domain-containing protein [Paenibacillus maysiensis]
MCKELNILRPQRKVSSSYPRKLARNRIITNSNQLFETDIKYGYIAGEDRFFFIQSCLEVYDRSVVAYHEHERIPPRTPNMNAHIESFHRLLQDECLARYDFETYSEAYEAVAKFIHFYNERRIHSSIGDLSPSQFYEKNQTKPIPIREVRVKFQKRSLDEQESASVQKFKGLIRYYYQMYFHQI